MQYQTKCCEPMRIGWRNTRHEIKKPNEEEKHACYQDAPKHGAVVERVRRDRAATYHERNDNHACTGFPKNESENRMSLMTAIARRVA